MVNAFFWASAGCVLLFVHPYLTYIASLRLFAQAPVVIDDFAALPSATLVFAAFNEQRALPRKITNLRAIMLAWPDLEIIAYSDASTDGTVPLLRGASDVLRVIASDARLGKAAGMRLMVQAAQGEIVIFTDANVLLEPAAIMPLLRYFTDPAVGGVAGSLRYINADAGTTAQVGGLYWRLEEAIKRQESRVGSIMGADGSIFAVRRALYPEVPPHLLDDMTASLSVIFAGYRLIHARHVVAYEKNATLAGEEFRRKRRIACRAFNTHRFLWPRIAVTFGAVDIYKYLSHKFLRWLGLLPLVLAAGFFAAGLALGGHRLALLALVAGALLAGVAGWADCPIFRTIYHIVLGIAATFLGVVDALRGKTYQTWTPAASRN
jgi:cellulose synthase/poly-beta-1,6-N-acetylglucosamine synthase-like glycosyltransferase